MSLHKIRDFDPDYRNHFEDQDIIGYDLYASGDKVGSVSDLLVDDTGKIRYLIINTGFWVLGKDVLLPIGQSQINYSDRQIIAKGLTRDQVEALPHYDGNMPVDYEYEEQVRNVYRPMGMGAVPVEAGASLDPTPALDYDRDTYNYDRDPALYNLDEQAHQNLRLYEERLIANKTRMKTGEVAVGKRVETETARVSVPIEKERIVIERTTPVNAGTAVAVGDATFNEGEVARVELYEETPDIRKEAFVREEVSIRKEVDRETVQAEETLRREELDVDTEGHPVVDGAGNPSRSNKRV
ncbi:MAG: DUF2382 domain-containing protein [Aphanocapsa sp. GSE-SYN-MK-11-07L]|jgi:uncharacterized protein (TIGR02271 family)|nr:DUF2382 domain-containing protein [Aphanocapsa sp. GSE-SYN-MK-11-07L]